MEKETTEKRVKYLEKLQKESFKKERAYQRKFIADSIRKEYSSLWIRRKESKEKVNLKDIPPEEKQPLEKDVFLVSSVKSQASYLQEESSKEEEQKNLHENSEHLRGEEEV